MELPLDAAIALVGLSLDAPRNDVRAHFRDAPELFKRTPSSSEADHWPSLGIFAYYDDADRLEALEFTADASPTLLGKALTSLPLQQAKQLLGRLDGDLEEDEGGAISRRLGLSVWSGSGERGNVQSVLRFRPGYYD